MIQIAHLSDIHFGNNFSKATWDAVADTVVRFDPHLIVVSGDLVDDPSPEHLLAAKCALSDLSRRARERSHANGNGRAAELIVVPGNHDVFESGLASGMTRLNWFERIFYAADTGPAEAALKLELATESLGFDPVCLGYAADTRPQDAGWVQRGWARAAALFSGRFIPPWKRSRDFANLLGAINPPPSVRTPASAPVLFALLDSNPLHPGFEVATGLVDNDQLIGLQSALANVGQAYVARIAVVHHHVLPIAFASGAARATGEPMMVLRNAGAVLRSLADHKFDLILHGHWHKSQFTRVDFGSDDRDSYPIAVAAAGSAAMMAEDNATANSINLITIAETGRIEVKSLFYGAGQAPAPNGEPGRHYRLYKEPLSAAKRRAYVRARERHGIESDEREQVFEITENGDLWVTHRVEALRIHGEIQRYPKRPLGISLPSHGHFVRETLELDEDSSRAGVTLSARPHDPGANAGDVERYWINLPGDGLTQGGEPASYALRYGCANCMMMTLWEARERGARSGQAGPLPAGFDNEWVGVRIGAPVRTLRLKLKFPQSLAMVQPHVECRRPPQHPHYEVDAFGDAGVNPGATVIDPAVQDEEEKERRYDAPTRTWILEVDRPFVGYRYSLRWQLPGAAENPTISGRTRAWQRVLLNLGQRIDAGTQNARDREAVDQFNLLCETLKVEVFKGGRDEKWLVALFVYDSDRLALRPILSRQSWTTDELPRNFEIPYGDGVSGAAFQQRRIIAWSRQPVNDDSPHSAPSLIAPDPNPAVVPTEIVNMLALPVYHSGSEDVRQPPPWATIGVVTIGSSSYASSFSGMDDAQRRRLRLAAQTQMDSIVQAALGNAPAASPN